MEKWILGVLFFHQTLNDGTLATDPRPTVSCDRGPVGPWTSTGPFFGDFLGCFSAIVNDFSGGSVSFSEPQDRLLTAPQRPAAAAVAPVAPPWTLPEVGWGWKGVNFGSSRSNFLNGMPWPPQILG